MSKKGNDNGFLTDQEKADIQAVMRMESGRRFVSRILGRARLYETSFAGASNQTIFNEGMRNLGLTILSEIDEACPQYVLDMMKEEQNARSSNSG